MLSRLNFNTQLMQKAADLKFWSHFYLILVLIWTDCA